MVRIEDLLYACLEAGSAREQQLAALCQAHPEHAAELRRMLTELAGLGFLTSNSGAPQPTAALPDAIGAYRVEGLVGRGGMGLVYRGRQTNLGDRPVAIKVIRPELVADARAEARFVREALLASKLDHPNLCGVLDVGRQGGVPYLVMPLVEGQTLAQHITAARQRQGTGGGAMLQLPGDSTVARAAPWWERTVALVEKLAHGLHAAHEAGLVHRDVKPGNVIVRDNGEPVLLDFGLARASNDATTQLTLTDEVLGTPAYMAPEQVSPRGRMADARTDVYALGVLLYECLTLQLPHTAATRDELARQIVDQPATDLRRHASSLPRDLAVLVQVALEKAPDHRYASAQLLAEDLRRVRERRPIVARRPGMATRTSRWIARNPWPTTAGVVLLIGLAVSLWLLDHLRRQETSSRALALVGASRAAAATDQSLALELALQATQVSDRTETRDQLRQAARGMHEMAVIRDFTNTIAAAGFSHGDQRSFMVSKNGQLRFADRDGHVVERKDLDLPLQHVLPVEPAGEPMLVLACSDGRVFLRRDSGTLEPIAMPRLDQPGSLAFGERCDASRDGRRVLLVTRTGRAFVVSIPDRAVVRELLLEDGGDSVPITCGALVGADGVLLGGMDGLAAFWRTGAQPVWQARHPGKAAITRIAVDGSGIVAVALAFGMPKLMQCSLEDGSTKLLEHQALGLCELVVSPDAAGFATGGNDGAIALWRFGDFGPHRVLVGHQSSISAIAYSDDGQQIVSASHDLTVRLWDVTGRALLTLPGHLSAATSVAIDARKALLMSGGTDNQVRFWRIAEGIPTIRHPLHSPLSFGRFCFGNEDGWIWLGDAATGSVWRANIQTGELTALPGTESNGSNLQIDLDRAETRLLVGREHAVDLYDAGSGKLIARQPCEIASHRFVGSDIFADGSTVVLVEDGGAAHPPLLTIWDVRRGSFELLERKELLDVWKQKNGYLMRADLSPDEQAVAVARLDGTVRVYDLHGEPRSPALDHTDDRGLSTYRATLSGDGSRLLSVGFDGRVELWTRIHDDRWQRRILTVFDNKVRNAYFDAGERRVVTGSDDGVLRVLDLDGQVLEQFVYAQGQIFCARFTDDGNHVVATTSDGRVTSWPLGLTELEQTARRLRIRDLTAAERTAYAELLDDGR